MKKKCSTALYCALKLGYLGKLGFIGGYRVAKLCFPEHLTIASGELAGHMLMAPLHSFQPRNYSHKNQELHSVHS